MVMDQGHSIGLTIGIIHQISMAGIHSMPRSLFTSAQQHSTGTPTLTGDFKVGQTISIDTSKIEDADNFEGWTCLKVPGDWVLWVVNGRTS